MNTNIEKFKFNQDLIYKKINSCKQTYFRDRPFDKAYVENLFNTLNTEDKSTYSEIISDKYFNQYLNNVLSKLVLNNELLRIKKGLYSFSSKLIDFKMSLEKKLSKLLIKDIISENKLLNSEAVILEKNIFVPEYLVKKNLDDNEKEIFFKKFNQYKIIKTPSNVKYIELYSLAKFYNSKNNNKKEYIKDSCSFLLNNLNEFKDKNTFLLDDLLKHSKKNKRDFNFTHVSDFVKNLKKEIKLSGK
jgi:hypothetical protein